MEDFAFQLEVQDSWKWETNSMIDVLERMLTFKNYIFGYYHLFKDNFRNGTNFNIENLEL